MSNHRSFSKIAALAIAVSAASAALPALADTTVSVEHGKHHYVYYSDKDIYYAPESKTYWWVDNGKWMSGPSVPRESQDYIVRAKGVDIDLDTERPYERNDYVVAHYKNAEPRETTTTERTTSDNGVTSTTTTTTTTKHRYVYYGDHDIYFAPETRTYYWMDNGRWTSGTTLPTEDQAYIRNGGVQIELDTDRPYERHDYVIAHYKHRDHDRNDD
jgi:hypothetical protein